MLVVVTPVKNEGERLIDLANQLVVQTLVPDLWIIVDDNSTDATSDVAKQLARDYKFVVNISLNECSVYDEVFRYGQVVHTGFNYALNFCDAPDFLGVLDADVKLKKNHYEALVNAFDSMPQLGIASGTFIESKNGTSCSFLENAQNLSICGADMTFRKDCLIDIGGFPTCPRPDTVALLKAANRGWKIGVVSSTYVIHLRGNISFDKYSRIGFANYMLGYHKMNALISGPWLALKNLSLSPLGFTTGYLTGLAKGNKIADEEITRYFRESFFRYIHKFSSLLSHTNVSMDPIENATVKL
jgi:glycosyltransferase involved in cell wall biosynthesis